MGPPRRTDWLPSILKHRFLRAMSSFDSRGKVFHVQYAEKSAVYNCYLSFCKDGGVFVPTSTPAHLGTPVHLLIELPGDQNLYAVSGKVIWINYGKRKGVGVRLHPDEFSKGLKVAIENLLTTSLRSPTPTYTM